MNDVLEEIMSTLKDSACSEAMLADKLCISTAEVQACLTYLEAMGYIRRSTFSGAASKEFCGKAFCNSSNCKNCCNSHFTNTQNILIWELN